MNKDTRGQLVVDEHKKKKEIIVEGGNRVDIPTDDVKEKKKLLAQTGDDVTSGW
ncbi:MAG: hypothetical protein LBI79_03355 [Nitrososphaerota archaeon]|nr:hypothetical protein [Nitrososphaerota archaeon]